jgi:hypothetical protein
MIETWLPVAGYESLYEVSDEGAVRSLDRFAPNSKVSARLIKGQIIAPHCRENGYKTVKLAKNGKKTNHYVHRLVALSFHGIGKPGEEVRHADGIKSHNSKSNLSWGTRLDNMGDRTRLNEHANGIRHGHAKLTENAVLRIRKDARLHAIIAAEHGVSRRLVGMIKGRKIWTHLDG